MKEKNEGNVARDCKVKKNSFFIFITLVFSVVVGKIHMQGVTQFSPKHTSTLIDCQG